MHTKAKPSGNLTVSEKGYGISFYNDNEVLINETLKILKESPIPLFHYQISDLLKELQIVHEQGIMVKVYEYLFKSHLIKKLRLEGNIPYIYYVNEYDKSINSKLLSEYKKFPRSKPTSTQKTHTPTKDNRVQLAIEWLHENRPTKVSLNNLTLNLSRHLKSNRIKIGQEAVKTTILTQEFIDENFIVSRANNKQRTVTYTYIN